MLSLATEVTNKADVRVEMWDDLPEHIRSLLEDFVTFEMPKMPLVVASDGYTYSLGSLKEHLKHDVYKRSPRTGEVLRNRAFRATDVERLIYGSDRDCGCNATVFTLYNDYPSPDSEHLAKLHFTLKTENVMTSVACVHLLNDAGLFERENVQITVHAHTSKTRLPTILTPPPVADMYHAASELLRAAGLAHIFSNPSHIATCKLDDGTTIESRVLTQRYVK